MRALLLALLLLPAWTSVRADDGEDTPVQRYLVSLQLGDNLEEVRRVYPPADEWPALESRNGVTRYRVTRAMAKAFPSKVETLYVGFKRGRLVEIEIVYDEKKSRSSTVNNLAADYSLIYGEPRRAGNRFWWSDGKTVMRVFHADVPIPGDGKNAVAWRTAVQIFDEGLFGAAD